MARFFHFSVKRQRLDKAIHLCMADSEVKAKKLKDACRTHWVERIDSYIIFLQLLPAAHTCLQAVINPNQHEELGTQWSLDGETITKAHGFLYQLQSSSFLVGINILMQILHILSVVMLSN